MGNLTRGSRLAFATFVAFIAGPAAAFAADTYVDADTGSDTDSCSLAAPCATIQAGIDAAGPGDTVHVDPGSYPLGLQIGDGIGLLADPFAGGAGTTTITGGGVPALDVLASGAGTVSGFSISASTTPVVDVSGPIDLRDNSIAVLGSNADGVDVTAGPAGIVTIADNEFFGDNTSGQTAIRVHNGSEAVITGNRVGSPENAFNGGIFAYGGATAEIAGNTLRSMFQSGSVAGQPILVQDATATITGNVVKETKAAPDVVYGILLFDLAAAPATDATLRRNQLYGGGAGEGISILDAASVTSDSDLVTGFESGVVTRDVSADSTTAGNIDATGLTAFDNVTSDIRLESASLTLDSSIVGSPIATSGTGIGGGVVGCAITYSRGPSTTPGGNGCADFQTTAAPAFVDASPTFGDPDLHLTAGSPMIDQGDPAAPADSAADIDGEARALDGDGECPEEVRRDIGADEFGEQLDCDPPQTRIKGPKRTTKERVRFRLRSDEQGSTFRCKLDGKPYRKCKSRYRTPRLEPGRHKLRAKAKDPAGNQDPTPAVKRFRVVG